MVTAAIIHRNIFWRQIAFFFFTFPLTEGKGYGIAA
jgi:hypothetical protein